MENSASVIRTQCWGSESQRREWLDKEEGWKALIGKFVAEKDVQRGEVKWGNIQIDEAL